MRRRLLFDGRNTAFLLLLLTCSQFAHATYKWSAVGAHYEGFIYGSSMEACTQRRDYAFPRATLDVVVSPATYVELWGVHEAVCTFAYPDSDTVIHTAVYGQWIQDSCFITGPTYSASTDNIRVENACVGGCAVVNSSPLVGVENREGVTRWTGKYRNTGASCKRETISGACPAGMVKASEVASAGKTYAFCVPEQKEDESLDCPRGQAIVSDPVTGVSGCLLSSAPSPATKDDSADTSGSGSIDADKGREDSPAANSPDGSAPENEPENTVLDEAELAARNVADSGVGRSSENLTPETTSATSGSASDGAGKKDNASADLDSVAGGGDGLNSDSSPGSSAPRKSDGPRRKDNGASQEPVLITPGLPAGRADDGGGDAKGFCRQNPGLTLCRNSSISARCGAFTCDGDAVVCAIARQQHKANCELAADRDKLRTASHTQLGNKLLAGNDPQAGSLPTPKNGQSIALSSLDQTGFLGGGECLSDKNISVFGKAIVIPLSKSCTYFLVLRYVIMSVAALAALRAIVGAVRN